ncbi:hypothetical protein ACHAXR_008549 [Thalassiosira sp. AJA248-18]
MLREYLTRCPKATNNSYSQFLDPLTKNLDVALDNLENHVIVGLQNDVEGTLQRWVNITLKACDGHPAYSTMSKTLAQSIASIGGKRLNSIPSTRVQDKDNVVLSSPSIAQLDEELQHMIQGYIAEDELIYRRAVELYQEQRHFGFQMNH